MTRRESLVAFLLAFLFFAGGLVWLLGGWGLLASGVLLFAASLFFERLEDRASGASMGDAVQEQVLAAYERDLSL